MSEFQPSNDKEPTPRIHIEINGVEYECTPDNTTVFKHTEEPQYDFIFLEMGHEYGNTDGQAFWRESVNNFDQLAEWLGDHEFPLIEVAEAADVVKEMYAKYKGEQADVTVKDNDPDRHLTPRQERFVGYYAYLLANDRLTAKDFGDNSARMWELFL